MTDSNTIIYGHNMKNGSMFANIKKFTDQDYFNNHPEVYIYYQMAALTYILSIVLRSLMQQVIIT